MNIFAVSPDPVECAQALDDRRVVKMTLETGQIISSARYLMGLTGAYRPTHLSHPCVLWTAASATHMIWTLMLLRALSDEYTHRYGRTHATWTAHFGIALPAHHEYRVPTHFANVTGFPEAADVHAAYRECLVNKWNAGSPRWTKRLPPVWCGNVIGCRGDVHQLVCPLSSAG